MLPTFTWLKYCQSINQSIYSAAILISDHAGFYLSLSLSIQWVCHPSMFLYLLSFQYSIHDMLKDFWNRLNARLNVEQHLNRYLLIWVLKLIEYENCSLTFIWRNTDLASSLENALALRIGCWAPFITFMRVLSSFHYFNEAEQVKTIAILSFRM